MPREKPEKFLSIERLINEGKTEEALEKIRKIQQNLWSSYTFNPEKALEDTLQNKKYIEKIGNDIDLGYNFLLTGYIYLLKENYKISLEFGFRCKDLFEKINNQNGVAASLTLIGNNYWLKGEYNQAIEYCTKSLSIEEISISSKASNLRVLANVFLWKGDLYQSLEYCEKGLKIAENENFFGIQVSFLWYLGMIFVFMYDVDKAENYLTRCCELAGKYQINYIKGFVLHTMINIRIEEDDMYQAERYLDYFREYAFRENDEFTTKIYSLSRGLVLIQTGRVRDRAEGETIFRQIINDGVSHVRVQALYTHALFYLTFIYVEELKMSKDMKILDDINPLISTMNTMADQLGSIMLQIEGKLFQARVSLIQMKLNEAKILLAGAQHLAESTNNHYLARLISNEHDLLLELQDNQEELENIKNIRAESIKLASLNGMVNITQKKNIKGKLELASDQPVLLLIIAEGGVLLFSYPFTDEWKHDTEIFGSFLSAFTSFIDEFFSEGLDRAKFGENTLLIQSIGNYSIGYLYKGQSYPAKQKLATFIKEIQDNTSIWQNLEIFFKTSQVAGAKDLPQIESLIKDTFLG
ncbi:MAG: tetratricopeptide repeat protein [Promethearchaeota archaeon]